MVYNLAFTFSLLRKIIFAFFKNIIKTRKIKLKKKNTNGFIILHRNEFPYQMSGKIESSRYVQDKIIFPQLYISPQPINTRENFYNCNKMKPKNYIKETHKAI